MRFRHILSETRAGLRQNLTMTLAVIMTMWVSLSLFGAGLLASQQVDLMKGRWYDKIEISVFAELRYDESANAIYQFTWGTLCDWYLELIKNQIDAETKSVAAWVFDQILVMLHPFMPFITEELWSAMGDRAHPLILAHWPMPDAHALDPEAGPEVDWLIRLVGYGSDTRSFRAIYLRPTRIN